VIFAVNSPVMQRKDRFVAAIDVGSNSTHLVVAQVSTSGSFQIVESSKEQTRLAADMDDRLLLDSNSLVKMSGVLKKMRSIAGKYDAQVRCIATHTLREARNGVEFSRRLSERSGLAVEIVSGLEEARLVAVGVMSGLALNRGVTLIVDVGGGSVEFVVCVDGAIKFATSIKLGAVRLTKKFLSRDPFSDDDLDSLVKYVDSRLQPVCNELSQFNFDVTVASSGTIKALKAMSLAMHGASAPKSYHGVLMSRSELAEVASVLFHNRSLQERKMLPQLDVKRADVIVAGALVLKRLTDMLNLKSFTLSTSALREGILIDTIAREHPTGYEYWGDVRWRSVVSFGEKLSVDEVHASRVRDLSLSLCDQLGFVGASSVYWRELIGFAAYLHECGKFLNLAAFHKHGFYLIKHSNMLGFTQKELEVIGLLVRYHRKRVPRPEDDELEILDKSEISIFCRCAALLRIVSCLDRSRRSRVGGVVYKQAGSGGAILELHGAENSELEAEIYEFEREKIVFEKEFRTKLALGIRNASK